MRGTLVVYFVFLYWIIYNLKYNEAVLFKFTNVVCESYNETLVVINKCRLHAINRNKTVFNFNATIIKPCNNIVLAMQVYKKANGYKPFVLKATIDACRFVKRSYNPFASLVYRLFKEFSNINHTWPYVGDQILDGFYLRSDLLGLPLPTGEYLLKMDWIFDKKKLAITNVYFEFKEDL